MAPDLYGKLTVVAGPDRGRSIKFPAHQKVVIGRDPRSDLQLADGEVSRLHCEVVKDDDGFWLNDLNSRNGTCIDGKRVERAKLANGVQLEIGASLVEFNTHIERTEADLPVGHSPSVAARERPTSASPPSETEAGAPLGDKDPFLGRRIGDFKIVSHIGQGDSTHVYKAIQFSKNRLVALKILLPDMAMDRSMMKRFIRGAKSGSQLRHPNIVRVLGGGYSDSVYYVWMEFVDGQNLKDAMEASGSRGRFDVGSALSVGIQIAEALKLAHSKNIVHRNIKPANVLVGKDGVVKVADLGLAKPMGDSDASDITDPGTILGTLNYMSPEQIQDAGVVDIRSDIYSVGATLYTILTGIEPFAAPTTVDTMVRIQKERIESPDRIVPDIPPAVNEIVLKAMAKDPADRYQTAGELLTALKLARAALS